MVLSVFLVLLTLLVFARADEPAVNDTHVRVSGSTTLGPIADAFAGLLREQNPDIKYSVKKVGSGDGAAALIASTCDIAIMSRPLKAEEYAKAVENGVFPMHHVAALDGLAVIVHPSNKVDGLSIQQVRNIYTGEIANWKDLGGADLPIVVLSRDTLSGTYETFTRLVMNGQKPGAGIEYINVSPQFHERVSTTPGAIAYCGLAFVDKKVKAMKINGVAPSAATCRYGKYPIARRLYFVTNGPPPLGAPLHEFINLRLTQSGQELIEQKGFIPLTAY
jgi:phosphate transport system substrate-binding protein